MTGFQAVHVQDSVSLADPPLPGGVASVVRFFLQFVPQWIQMAGVVLGAVVAAVVLVVLWRRRRQVWTWLTTRSRGVKIAIGTALALVMLAGAGFGAVSWNYMQHDNGFCTGCHVMGAAYARFTASEHDTLSCHDCHQQPITASMRQLYLWVRDRPDEIGPHSPVPNRVCEQCHVTDQPELWQRIASTAGHRTHLESDSSALDDVMCVTCHGLEVHRFVPVDSTCGQAGCHVNQAIALGPMAEQTALHCVTCHQFTAEVPLLATRDSAAGTLVPEKEQCVSCHEMQEVLAEFDVARDPHGGTCGMCHNPHEQESASEAARTCATARCHVDWRAEPFHVGPSHGNVGESCTLCHTPHSARVDPSDCAGCHAAIAADPSAPPRVRQRLRRVQPFDTTRALRREAEGEAAGSRLLGRYDHVNPAPPTAPAGRPITQEPRASPPARPAVQLFAGHASVFPPLAQPDTFSHDRHESLSCLTCHTTAAGHGRLTFQPPRGCQICHHQAPRQADCSRCHQSGELPATLPAVLRVSVRGAPARDREVRFRHGVHRDLACVRCHVAPVTLAPRPDAAACRDCHEDHHAANRRCGDCHTSEHVREPHAPPAQAHVRCDACHPGTTVARLVPDRSFCLTCHAAQAEQHHPERPCTTCHMLADPETFRARLTGGS